MPPDRRCPYSAERRITVPTAVAALPLGTSPVVYSTTIDNRPLARMSSASWWFRSSDGRLILWQLPNVALAVWFVTLALAKFDLPTAHSTAVGDIGRGALLVWALDEVVRGASPFRRVLGAVVLAIQLAAVVLG